MVTTSAICHGITWQFILLVDVIFFKLGNYLEGLGFCAFLLLSKHELVGKKPRVGKVFTNEDYNR